MISTRRFAPILALVTLFLAVAGCHSQPKRPLSFSEQVAAAHGVSAWKSNEAMEGDLHVEFKDPETSATRILDAHFAYHIPTGRVTLRLFEEKTRLLWDGQQMWVSPASATVRDPRGTALSWVFFLTLPFRLQEPGAMVGDPSPRPFGDATYTAAQVTFDAAQRGWPYDWCIPFANPATHRLVALAAGRKGEKPIAVTYYDLKYAGGGAVLSHEWKFWQFKPDQGIYGLPIGSATIYNIDFLSLRKDAFDRPADARAVP